MQERAGKENSDSSHTNASSDDLDNNAKSYDDEIRSAGNGNVGDNGREFQQSDKDEKTDEKSTKSASEATATAEVSVKLWNEVNGISLERGSRPATERHSLSDASNWSLQSMQVVESKVQTSNDTSEQLPADVVTDVGLPKIHIDEVDTQSEGNLSLHEVASTTKSIPSISRGKSFTKFVKDVMEGKHLPEHLKNRHQARFALGFMVSGG